VLGAVIRRLRTSVRARVVSGTIVALGITAIVFGFQTIDSQRTVLLREIDEQGQLLVRAIATFSVDPMLQDNYDIIEDYLLTLTRERQRIVYARVVRGDGRNIVEVGNEPAPDQRVFHYAHPVQIRPSPGALSRPADQIGTVILALSTRRAEEVLAASRRTLMVQALGTFLVLTIALIWMLDRVAIDRIGQIGRQVAKLGEGDLDSPIALSDQDEFGRLAQTIDDVRQKLRTSHQAIQAQNQRLRQLDQLKSEFLARMSHEIRTPMNGILGYSRLLQETGLDADQTEMVDTVVRSGEALLTILNDILDLSKVEAGKMELEQIPFDPAATVTEVTRLFGHQAETKGVALELDLAPDLPPVVTGDPVRLRQVLANLVANAIKFTDAGKVTVSVRRAAGQHAAERLEFCVADTGIGIPPRALSDLFSPFHQADGSTTRRFGGTGLGLAIAKAIVELMGGTITVESTEGHGSRFTFAAEFLPVGASAARQPLPSCKGRRLLLVQPTACTQAAGEAAAAELGLDLQIVADVDQARAAIAAAKRSGPAFDGVLLDLDRDEARLCKFAESLRHGGVAVLAASSQRPDGAPNGFERLMLKPLGPDQLATALRSLWSQPAPPATRTPILAKGHVLLVEDNVVNQTLTRRILGALGCRVDIAVNGREALELCSRPGADFDLILMDCQMPEMDGYEATRAIRQLPGSAARTPIVAMTANAMAGDRERCLRAGMDDFLAKPFPLAELRSKVAQWLSGGPTEA
jgi:signal transduction histidine kinase/CheY-like chemotaxis protein